MRAGLSVGNPKRKRNESVQSNWYRYYPGFSENFARDILSSAEIAKDQWILDPWNGSGTSTSTAISLGVNACGYDLNPVMVLVAKARSLNSAEYSSLLPLTAEILNQANQAIDQDPKDPLLRWLLPQSAASIRALEAATQKLLVDNLRYLPMRDRGVDHISDLAAFFYVALFRMIKRILRPFLTSNPTWVKQPTSCRGRLRPDGRLVRKLFLDEVKKMLPRTIFRAHQKAQGEKTLVVASSERLPLRQNSVDFVLASPPYCTRIDYAVATSLELALMGFSHDAEFDELRRKLIGTSTVPDVTPSVDGDFGETCLNFLDAVSKHRSRASATYYYKNHMQYFCSISKSLSEIVRVLKPHGKCVLVVQDSFYKDIHNDLPQIFKEMADSKGLRLTERHDFLLSRTMAGINPGANDYRNSFNAIESVLVLVR